MSGQVVIGHICCRFPDQAFPQHLQAIKLGNKNHFHCWRRNGNIRGEGVCVYVCVCVCAGVDASGSLRELVQDNHVRIQARLPQVGVWDLKRAELHYNPSRLSLRPGSVGAGSRGLQGAPGGSGGLQRGVPAHDIIHNASFFCTVWLTET